MTDFFGSVRSIELQNTSLTEEEVGVASESEHDRGDKWVELDTPLEMLIPEAAVVSVLRLCYFVSKCIRNSETVIFLRRYSLYFFKI